MSPRPRSVIGPYLGLLGAGEFLGYGLRLFSGRGADRTGRYWPITIGGYALQMSVVPLLALARSWPVAALLIIAERVGKATRNPPRDAMLSHAARTSGTDGRSACTRRSTSSAPCPARCSSP